MAWSLSQDDDGLESVQPQAAPPTGPGPSVIVDPISQIPPADPRGREARRRRSTEPTLVLGERQIDSLRQEMVLRQKKLKLQKQLSLAGWLLLGALAVAGGAWLSVLLQDGQQDEPAGAEGPAGVAPASVPVAKATASPAPGGESQGTGSSQSPALPGESHLHAGAAPEARDSASSGASAPASAPAPAPARVPGASGAQPPARRVYTLDDLPTE